MRSRSGKTLAEYALLLELIVLVSVPAVIFLGGNVENLYLGSDPIGKAQPLFSLLAPANKTAGAPATSPAGSGQPLSNVFFNYDPATGMVSVFLPGGSPAGTTTTSADGTQLLAQNLADILINNGSLLTPEQQDTLGDLSRLGFKLADAERDLLARYPALATGQNVNLQVFDGSNLDSSIYYDYQAFNQAYSDLIASLDPNDPVTANIIQAIETNSSIISQLAYYNFIEMQARPENTPGTSWDVTAAQGMVCDGVDVTQITADQSPVVTDQASQNLQGQGV
jgi:hypothetical protein